MKNSEKQQLKRKLGRLGLFFLIVFVPIIVLAVVLQYVGAKQWVNIMVLVIVMFLMYALYIFVCSKLDARKAERMKNKKDPFSD